MSQRFELIAAEKENFDVIMMCRLLGVSTSGFYDWLDRPASASQQRRENLKVLIQHKFHNSGRTYGYRRICGELNRQGVAVDDKLVRTLMRELELTPVQVKRCRKGLTVPDRQAAELPDLLGRDFTADLPGGAMVGDITQIDTAEGPLFEPFPS
ncbi:IS3 family transposase [Bounagaea algeriensis]